MRITRKQARSIIWDVILEYSVLYLCERILRCSRIVVEAQYIIEILEGGLDDEVVRDTLRESQRVKFLEPVLVSSTI